MYSNGALIKYEYTPGKLTWNLKITPNYKGKIIFQPSIFGFHVNFPGCNPEVKNNGNDEMMKPLSLFRKSLPSFLNNPACKAGSDWLAHHLLAAYMEKQKKEAQRSCLWQMESKVFFFSKIDRILYGIPMYFL